MRTIDSDDDHLVPQLSVKMRLGPKWVFGVLKDHTIKGLTCFDDNMSWCPHGDLCIWTYMKQMTFK